MSPRARRGFGALAAVVLLGGTGAFLALGGNQPPAAEPVAVEPPAVAPPQAEPPQAPGVEDGKLKRVQSGFDLGRERAGFSGLPMLQIFVDERVDQVELDACLEDPAIKALIPNFTGILISAEDEAGRSQRLRRKERHGVFVRAVNGKYLGILPPEYSCEDLRAMLERVLANRIMKPRKSPIYASLLESPGAIDRLVAEGKSDRARKFVDFLKEFEGKDHPAAVAAEARLPGMRDDPNTDGGRYGS